MLVILVSALFTLIFGMAAGYLFYGSDMMDYINGSTSFTDPRILPLLKYLQLVNTLGLFLFPPLVFALLTDRKPLSYIKLDRSPSLLSTIAGISMIIVILPFLHWTAGINEMLKLPEFLAGLEDWMKESEAQAAEITKLFLSTGSFKGLLVNMLMIAVLPALGEEFLFRGVLLRLFREWTGRVHLAVIISALLFSALHLQFYGFIPRFILGLILGYLFVWTRSIWVPVIVHFVNNGVAVTAAWLYERGTSHTDVESLGSADQPFMIVSSLVMVIALVILVKIYEGKKKGSTVS
ncbi:MAG TPA: CPBP family intramembrane glutamic endopeptidase [Bacteroidales bacterium]|nr:CPBP family intramembrane glutamic endopeptidase [Bacteroidales bacterium]